MATLPGIIIKIGADTKDAVDGLNRVNSAIGQATSPTQRFGTAVAAVGGALVAAFSAERVITFLQESAQAAIQDEKSMVALAKAMENVGLAQKNAAAEDLIRTMSLQFGIADDQLRPAFQRLVTATKDVEQSQRLLQTAMDISAAGYTDLESASKALSAASMGNFTALQRLKLPLDANTIAAKDFEGAIAQLNQVVGGQAAAAAETYQGKLNRLSIAADEAKETIGYALLNALDDVSNSMGGTDGLVANITSAGNAIAGLITGVNNLVRPVLGLFAAFGLVSDAGGTLVDKMVELGAKFGWIIPGVGTLTNLLSTLSLYGQESSKSMRGVSSATVGAAVAAGNAVGPIDDMGNSLDAAAAKAINAALGIGNAADVWAAFKSQIASGAMSYADVEAMRQRMDKLGQSVKDRQAMYDRAVALFNRPLPTRRDEASGSRGDKKSPIKQAAEDFVLLDDSAKRALQGVNQMATGYDDLTRRLGADDIAAFARSMLAAGQATDQTKGEFEAMVGVVRDKLNAALSDAKDRLKAVQQQYDDLNGRVQQGITAGNGLADAAQAQADATQRLAEAQKAYDAAVKGEKPEEIEATSKALAEAKDQQGTFLSFLQKGVDSAEAFSGQIQQLVKANASLELVSQIVQMGARTGGRIAAELLAGGAEAINQANRMVEAVSVAAATAGEMAARTFYGAGLASATAYVTALETQVQPLLQNLLNSIAAQIASALRQPVNANLGSGAPTNPTTAAIAAPFSAALGAYAPTTPGGGPNIPSGEGRIYAELRALSRRAGGGPVSPGVPYLVGEVGPEVVTFGSQGYVTPNKALGGNTYNINVSAGVGDPRIIGQQIVQYIKRFEQSSGGAGPSGSFVVA